MSKYLERPIWSRLKTCNNFKLPVISPVHDNLPLTDLSRETVIKLKSILNNQ